MTAAVLLLFAALLLPHAADAAALDCRRLPLRHDGTPVVGPEDVVHDPASGSLFVSAHDRRGERGGGVYRLPVTALDGETADLERLWPAEAGVPVRPHGIGFDPQARRLALIDHATPGRLDVFAVDGQGALTPVERIEDPRLLTANDVVPDGRGGWLVSLDRGSETGVGRLLETVFALDRGKVIRAGDPAPVADDILFPNGLLRDPETGRLHVASTRGQEVLTIGDGRRVGTLPVPGGPDNLSWTGDGRILAALIPSPLRLGFALKGWLGVEPPGARVAAVDPATGAVEVLFDDPEGVVLRAATSAVQAGAHIVVGSVLEDAVAVCR